MKIISLLFMGTVAAVQQAISLGTAANYVVLSKTGIMTTAGTVIVGNLAVSPIAAASMTGFGLIMDSTNEFSTSSLVTGKIYAADYTSPTPTKLTTAISDMALAYTEAAGRSLPDTINLGTGLIGGMTLASGLHKWDGTVNIQSDVTFSGNPTDVWVLQIAGGLALASGRKIVLAGGASPSNIYWQVAGATTLEANSVLNGNLLCKLNIAMKTGAALIGRALAQTAVTLISNSVKLPPPMCMAIALASVPPTSIARVTPKYQLQPTGVDQYGTGCIFQYTSNDTKIATVSTTGLVAGVRVGSVRITIRSGLQNRNVSFFVV